MAIATDAKITNLDRVWPDIANQRRPHQKTVAIKFDTASIVVVMKTSLNRVALANEVLPEDVCDVNVLMARVETVQTAVRVLLEHREVCGVELIAIVVKRAKHSRAKIVIGKNKTAKVGNKWLDAGAQRKRNRSWH